MNSHCEMTGDCKLSILIQILLFVRRNSAKCNNKLIKYIDEGANFNQNMKNSIILLETKSHLT